ncbi:MAG: glutamate decarboxylase [Solirubrobacterales bacterium]|nr:glutamate decarboxylase [Solirubrobacterales bacterium]
MHRVRTDLDDVHAPAYAARLLAHEVPAHRFPLEGATPQAAAQLVRDELNLDGNPTLNLASFVSSWMEPEADALALTTLNKNLIDQDEYPQSQVIHQRVISMLGDLFHAPDGAWGTATIGSSEAIMLGLLAHKRAWQSRRKAAGEPIDRPNLIFGADVHTCWEKFANYFEVEQRIVPLTDHRHTIGPEQVEPLVDERTIAVGAVVGTTFTGQMDDVAGIDALLGRIESERGWHIPLHVDAASGGFLLPFCDPETRWDFRLPHVRSINVSNHKYGLVYPGMGSVVFREKTDVPEELVFHIDYLGGDMPNYSLNFSRPSTAVLLQYFAFLRLGRDGYERIVRTCLANARVLTEHLEDTGCFAALHDGRRFPVVVVRATHDDLDLYALAERLRERGWIVPAYHLPPDAEDLHVLRMVVKENLSRDMVTILADDVKRALKAVGQAVRPERRRRHKRQPVC